MGARSGGEEGERPMDLHAYASVVEDNYQRLADILLSADPTRRKCNACWRLTSSPHRRSRAATPSGPRVCWPRPSPAFPPRPSQPYGKLAHRDRQTRTYRVCPKPSRCGATAFATALSAWLTSDTLRLHARAITASPSTPKGSNVLCDAEAPRSRPTCIRPNYAELVRFTRDWDLGVAPRGPALWTPPPRLNAPGGHAGVETADEARRIAMLRCLSRLCVPHQPVPDLGDTLATLAAEADSRRLEREAIIALCHLDRTQACAYHAAVLARRGTATHHGGRTPRLGADVRGL